MGASVFVAKRGGKIVTCAATSGYMIEYDNRHLWMRLKQILSSHFANYSEAWAMNRLIDQGKIQPILSKTFALANTGEAANQVHHNLHEGKLGILCLAPKADQGITDLEKRQSIGENKITLFSRHAESIENKN
jgi:crotonyl-CoA reductase